MDSGLSAKEFAAETGVNANTLAHWRWRLGAEARRAPAKEAAPVRFVELAAAPDAAAPAFELVLSGGRTVRVPPRFDGAELARLVQVLEGALS
ncbi:MAG: hypothetical protein QM767_05115 [Anaeromyxobacter sp.]